MGNHRAMWLLCVELHNTLYPLLPTLSIQIMPGIAPGLCMKMRYDHPSAQKVTQECYLIQKGEKLHVPFIDAGMEA